jgi:transposase
MQRLPMLLAADFSDDPEALRAIIAGQAEEQRRLADRVAELARGGSEAEAEAEIAG